MTSLIARLRRAIHPAQFLSRSSLILDLAVTSGCDRGVGGYKSAMNRRGFTDWVDDVLDRPVASRRAAGAGLVLSLVSLCQ